MFCNMKQSKSFFWGSRRWWYLFWGVVLLVSIDLLTKTFFRQQAVDVLNTGGVRGVKIPIVLSIVMAIIFVGIMIMSYKKRLIWLLTAILFVSGALWNLYDRLVFQGVRDWVSFQDMFNFQGVFGFQFPHFNVADMCLVVGMCIVFFEVVFPRKKIVEKKS